MQVSHSKIETFSQCGFKYKLKYVDRWEPDKTFSALLFGAAIDEALNYILECVKDNKEIDIKQSKTLFYNKMNTWFGQNEFVYFKNELPEYYDDSQDLQLTAFTNLLNVGDKIIETYVSEVLPSFKSIDGIQIKHDIKNAEGDNLIIILDFIATLHDGRKVLFDNKTSSDIKKYYGPNCVKNSSQLALYTDYYPDYHSGYIALSKKLDKEGKIKWTMVVDKIEESKTAEVFNHIETKTQMIKDEMFEKNQKSCFSFGRKCEFWSLCKYNNPEGLKKR